MPAFAPGIDLRLARTRARLTQQEVADAAGWSRQHVSGLERQAYVLGRQADRYREAVRAARNARTDG
jgi:transcriptional regulator with XRE-family HTH domain